MTIPKKLSAVLFTGVLMSAVSVVTAPAASAGNCTYVAGQEICGMVKNSGASTYSLLVTGDYGDKDPRSYVCIGCDAPYKDDDGWYLPTYRGARVCIGQETPDACYTTTASGWHKKEDGTKKTIVKIYRTSYA